MNFTDPSGHRGCELVCEGDLANQQELQFGSAYGGDWDPDQQAANAAIAETVLVDVPQSIVGLFWEPADWGFALSDGFQWYDGVGMLPLIPASVGRYGDDFGHLAKALIYRVDEIHSQLDPFAQNKRTTAMLLATDSQAISISS